MRRIIFVLALVALAGCAQKDPTAIMNDIQRQTEAGRFARAIKLSEAALANPIMSAQKEALFTGLLKLRLKNGEEALARQGYLDVIGKDPTLETAGYPVVSTFLREAGRAKDLAEWLAILSKAGWVSNLKGTVLNDYVAALLAAGRPDDAVAAAVDGAGSLQAPASIQFIDQTLQALEKAGVPGQGVRLADAVEGRAGAEMDELVRRVRVEMLLLAGRWGEGEDAFIKTMSTLPDPVLSTCLTKALQPVRKAREWERADRLCRAILDHPGEHPKAEIVAAREWPATAEQMGNLPETASRLASLAAEPLDCEQIGWVLGNHFYAIANTGSNELLRLMVDTADKLTKGVTNTSSREYLQGLAFDAAFLLEDYDRTLKILKEGMPSRQASWQTMAENKILAHKALKEKDFPEAARRFRDFMKNIEATWTEPEQDPSTGMTYTKEMTLGFNAARICKILGQAGDKAGAKSARVEATGYYEKALKELKPDSREYKYVKDELAALPAEDKE
jgi:hypothetical protein